MASGRLRRRQVPHKSPAKHPVSPPTASAKSTNGQQTKNGAAGAADEGHVGQGWADAHVTEGQWSSGQAKAPAAGQASDGHCGQRATHAAPQAPRIRTAASEATPRSIARRGS